MHKLRNYLMQMAGARYTVFQP